MNARPLQCAFHILYDFYIDVITFQIFQRQFNVIFSFSFSPFLFSVRVLSCLPHFFFFHYFVFNLFCIISPRSDFVLFIFFIRNDFLFSLLSTFVLFQTILHTQSLQRLLHIRCVKIEMQKWMKEMQRWKNKNNTKNKRKCSKWISTFNELRSKDRITWPTTACTARKTERAVFFLRISFFCSFCHIFLRRCIV